MTARVETLPALSDNAPSTQGEFATMSNPIIRLTAVFATVLFAVAAGSARADTSADLFAAYQKMLDGRFSSEMVSTSKGKETRMQAKYDTIRRVHMKAPDTEIILLPEGTWMNMGGQWTKPPFDVSGMVQAMLPKNLEAMRSDIANVKDEGASEGLRAISFDQNTKFMGITVSAHNKVFLNGAGQIVRSESQSKAMGTTTTSTQTFRYDDSIRITAPN